VPRDVVDDAEQHRHRRGRPRLAQRRDDVEVLLVPVAVPETGEQRHVVAVEPEDEADPQRGPQVVLGPRQHDLVQQLEPEVASVVGAEPEEEVGGGDRLGQAAHQVPLLVRQASLVARPLDGRVVEHRQQGPHAPATPTRQADDDGGDRPEQHERDEVPERT